VIFLFGSEIRKHQDESPAPLALFEEKQSPRMRAMIGVQKPHPFLRGEVTNLDDGMHMLRRNRRLIGRVDDLGDKASVLAERFSETLPHAGRTSIKDVPQDGLVGRNRVLRILWGGLRAHLGFARIAGDRGPDGSKRAGCNRKNAQALIEQRCHL
jgi:hypothetical protein